MTEFTRNIEITFDDFIDFNLTHYRKYRVKPLYVWIVVFVIGTAIYLTGMMKDPTMGGSSLAFIFFYLVMFTLSAAVIWISFFIIKFVRKPLWKILLRRSFRSQELGKSIAEIIINEKGFQSKTDKMTLAVVWDQILKIAENEKTFYCYFGKSQAFILPKRYLNSLDELCDFKQFVQSLSNNTIEFIPKQ